MELCCVGILFLFFFCFALLGASATFDSSLGSEDDARLRLHSEKIRTPTAEKSED